MSMTPIRTLLQRKLAARTGFVCSSCRHYAAPPSSALPAPPLLLKLRRDLKTAMKEKDTSRLNVLRGLLSDVTSQAKTSNPVRTDMQILSMLRKRAASAKAAGEEFKAAGRSDLVDKEEGQAKILEEYAGDVETMSEDDIRNAVSKSIDAAKAEGGKVNMGDVLKRLLGPGGSLDGKPVEKADVAKYVKEQLASSS
ncbi:hypothetical protein MBLNU230_g3231t1 [Neophaeotheca triangularis]